ncbi:MAG: DUF4153 domain-containing protein [Sphingomonas sp.]|nr:DUF4153 domain-containing protein [Sphingomonas sp.]
MAERFDVENRDWPERPWIMAGVGAVAGLLVHLLTNDAHDPGAPFPVWKQAATSFTVIAALSFLLTVELRRWTWSIAFAACWGAVIALVGWYTAQYNRVPDIFEFPFLSGILAVLIAAPLFQTVRDTGAWRFPYARLHRHAWTDAVIGAAGLIFTGITFLLSWLIAALFDVIGIEAIRNLLEKEWFAWCLAGLAFGGAVGLLRERDALLATLQKLVMVVLAVLAPVMAAALGAFLLSIPFTGLSGLWESDIPATPMLLLSGAGAVLLANAVIGDGEEERTSSLLLRRAALVLVICVLPLSVLAALSMGERINQYGWTPERIWGVVAVAIAISYGLAAWWAVYRGRASFDQPLRPLQTRLAIALCGLALLLALPIIDFGAVSARSQLARLEAGKIKAEEFDWTAMAFEFGPEGRGRLAAMARSGPAELRELARTALASENRYDLRGAAEEIAQQARVEERVRLLSPDIELTAPLKQELTGFKGCNDRPCALMRLDAGRLLLVHNPHGVAVQSRVIDLASLGKGLKGPRDAVPGAEPVKVDLARATIELRPVNRRQLYVEGKPVGEPVE